MVVNGVSDTGIIGIWQKLFSTINISHKSLIYAKFQMKERKNIAGHQSEDQKDCFFFL